MCYMLRKIWICDVFCEIVKKFYMHKAYRTAVIIWKIQQTSIILVLFPLFKSKEHICTCSKFSA